MYIDSHTHLDLLTNSTINIKNILQNATSFKISKIVQVSASLNDFANFFPSLFELIYFKNNDFANLEIFFTFGASPNDLCQQNFEYENLLSFFDSFNYKGKSLYDFIYEKKLVAIGEIGLDYFHKFFEKNQQKLAFTNQLELSKKLNLPVMLHIRDAFPDAMDILKSFELKNNIIFHCYSGDVDITKEILSNFENCFFSFAGNITYKKMEFLRQSLSIIPLDKILIETDAPFLAPIPYRGKDNMPWYIIETYRFIANHLKINEKDLIEKINKNFNKAFNL